MPRKTTKPAPPAPPAQHVIPFTLAAERFVARGNGPRAEVVVRSIARRVANTGVTLWPGNATGEYRAQWFDPEQDIFCEAAVAF